MQLSVFQSPGSDVCRQWDREVVEPSPKPFLCPPQGEGSTERVGTADPGWFWGSLSFSRYKGKVLTFPLPPVEKCHWKLFSMLVVWFSLIFPLDLVSACFSSSFRKQRVVSHCSCQECGREVPPFPCHTAHSYCREGCSQSGNAPIIHVGGPQWGFLGVSPSPWVFVCHENLCFVQRKPSTGWLLTQCHQVCLWFTQHRYKPGLGLRHQLCFPSTVHPNVCKQQGE